MTKKVSSTRNTTFNYYIENNTINSIGLSVSANAKQKNIDIKLLEHTDYIKITGKQINNDAAKNTTYKELKNSYNSSPISTGIDENENNNTFKLYGSPHKWVFINRQHYNNCGVVSCMNILAMSNKTQITNQKNDEKQFTYSMWKKGWCEDDNPLQSFGPEDGGTNLTSIKYILNSYNIDAEVWSTDPEEENDHEESLSINSLAEIIKGGGAAIVAIDSQMLCYGESDDPAFNHAILVTGVVYDEADELRGFYIHDSGVWMTRYISATELKSVAYYDVSDDYKTEGFFCTVVPAEANVKYATNNINAYGNNYSNIIRGNSSDNTIYGNGGNDTLYGEDGKDILNGGNGNDTIYGGNGNDTIYGGNGNDNINGDDGDDTVIGGNGNDTIYGNNGEDTLHGNNGNDTIYGNDCDDIIYGDNGNDKLYGGNGSDIIYGGKGNDTIYGGDDADKIYGGAGNDTIFGGNGNDTIDCGTGNDHVYIDKNSGIDTVTSASGSITFHFDDITATEINYEINDTTLIIGYDDLNHIEYNDFYNPESNKFKTTYIVDENAAGTTTKYRFCTTYANGKIKVLNSKGNNILYSAGNNNNKITTSKYSDIIFMNGGNDTITYTGGKDIYYSTNGDDEYYVNAFNKKTNLTINDTSADTDNDSVYINTNKKDIGLFFDVTNDGKINSNNDLFLFNKSVIKNETNFNDIIADKSNGIVTLSDYFNSDSEFEQGGGYINSILAKNGKKYAELNINSVISNIAEEVTKWLEGTEYSSAFDAIQNNAENVNNLIAIYNTAEIDIINN